MEGDLVVELSPPTPFATVAGTCDLDSFACGEIDLDAWLKGRAAKADGKTARTYVVLCDRRVVAYYCIAAAQIERERLPKRLQRNTPEYVPGFVLGRLAVDRNMQGRGLGQDLVAHCFRQCLAAAELVGARVVLVHPLHDRLVRFYSALGFSPLPSNPLAMFIPIETIAQAFGTAREPPSPGRHR